MIAFGVILVFGGMCSVFMLSARDVSFYNVCNWACYDHSLKMILL